MRKTKIVCTLGPSTDREGVLREMIQAGMNVARFNFSHGTHAEHKARLDALKALREELDAPVAAMLDTKGPEVRLKDFAGGRVHLTAGQEFTLTTVQVEGDAHRCSITYGELPGDVKAGDTILLDDGLVRLTVLETTETEIRCRVENDGDMKNHKGVNVPGVRLNMPYMSQQDRDDLLFGAEQGFDYVAASFVRSAADVRELRHVLDKAGSRMRIIAKIENQEGVSNLPEILDGGSRRYGCGDRLCGDPPDPKEYDRPVCGLRQAGHHSYTDAGFHDGKSPAHPCGDHRRGQRHL